MWEAWGDLIREHLDRLYYTYQYTAARLTELEGISIFDPFQSDIRQRLREDGVQFG